MKVIRLTGADTYASERTYGFMLRRNQTIRLRDIDANRILQSTQGGVPLFTLTSLVTATFDASARYNGDDPVVYDGREGLFLAGEDRKTRIPALVSGAGIGAVAWEGQPAPRPGANSASGQLVTRFITTGITNNSGANLTLSDVSGWDGITVDPAAWDGTTKRNIVGPGQQGSVTDIDNATGLVTRRIGSRTGAPTLLKAVPVSGATIFTLPPSYIGTPYPLVTGALGLWVYIDALPGHQPAGTATGTITIGFGTRTNGTAGNYFNVTWNANVLREGWNFLVCKRGASPFPSGTGVIEADIADGADANIAAGLSFIQVQMSAGLVGATLYFDSMWCNFSMKPQLCLGVDAFAQDVLDIALPIFQSYGWVGYCAAALSGSGTETETTMQTGAGKDPGTYQSAATRARIQALYDAGWDVIDHSTTHRRLGDMTDKGVIAFERNRAQQWRLGHGWVRGSEFYASPQGSTSRVSEGVLRQLGVVSQRNGRGFGTHVTPHGIDNPHQVGGFDMGSLTNGQTFAKLKAALDACVDHQCTMHGFWHFLQTAGDPGDGTGSTGDALYLYASAFRMFCAYARSLELAGTITVCKGYSGFYYGKN